jgi:hypothetical protein
MNGGPLILLPSGRGMMARPKKALESALIEAKSSEFIVHQRKHSMATVWPDHLTIGIAWEKPP